MADARMYVIGDREEGLILVKTNPLKLVTIPKTQIEAYARTNNKTYDEVFGLLAARTRKAVNLGQSNPPPLPDDDAFFESIGFTVRNGGSVTEAEFCFIAEIDNTLYSSIRVRIDPIKTALHKLNTAQPPVEEVGLDPSSTTSAP